MTNDNFTVRTEQSTLIYCPLFSQTLFVQRLGVFCATLSVDKSFAVSTSNYNLMPGKVAKVVVKANG
jgi:hypothetical protein